MRTAKKKVLDLTDGNNEGTFIAKIKTIEFDNANELVEQFEVNFIPLHLGVGFSYSGNSFPN